VIEAKNWRPSAKNRLSLLRSYGLRPRWRWKVGFYQWFWDRCGKSWATLPADPAECCAFAGARRKPDSQRRLLLANLLRRSDCLLLMSERTGAGLARAGAPSTALAYLKNNLPGEDPDQRSRAEGLLTRSRSSVPRIVWLRGKARSHRGSGTRSFRSRGHRPAIAAMKDVQRVQLFESIPGVADSARRPFLAETETSPVFKNIDQLSSNSGLPRG